ncbi:C4-dicarboxylate ABC transporter [Roseivivax halodurans JCM 10272]|uniref:TRAP transporter small permease protein n=1 Tax=Roseivivax halodurans JCM 10272 TaxID=1449350 RepID=X7ECV8_9RHOB|nr:TRAP transporter small permease subunit [Roseivivax halodurans]ETX13036.1 C4-dicarboxylate ABC transporter [Roseivivax halodurans JCM 10272]
MAFDEAQTRSGAAAAVAQAVTAWALLGGVVLLGIVVINVLSVAGGIVGTTFPGDFELTEMGIAIAVFAFLPYCQLMDANVTADIFTSGLPERRVAALRALAALIAMAFAAILLWRMYLGMLDQKTYNYMTTILQVPVWWAFVPILVSLALLIAASIISLAENAGEARR